MYTVRDYLMAKIRINILQRDQMLFTTNINFNGVAAPAPDSAPFPPESHYKLCSMINVQTLLYN